MRVLGVCLSAAVDTGHALGLADFQKVILGKSRESGCCGYRGGLVFKALVSLSSRLKDLLGSVTRVKKKKTKLRVSGAG